MDQILYFLLRYHDEIFLAMFGALAVVTVVNFIYNPYASQNRKLKRFSKRTLQKPSSIVWETKGLPEEYQRQWRAYVNSGCTKPSIVFEFVKRPQKYLLWFVHFVALALCVAYFVLAFMLNNQEFFITQIAFVLFSALIVLLKWLIALINLSRARRVFGKFLHSLNVVVDIVKSDKSNLQTTSSPPNCTPIANLQNQAVLTTNQDFSSSESPSATVFTSDNSNISNKMPAQTQTQVEGQISLTEGPNQSGPQSANSLHTQPPYNDSRLSQICKNRGDVMEKMVQILQQKGLDSPRTVEEQRKLNIALNNLLQACCKK